MMCRQILMVCAGILFLSAPSQGSLIINGGFEDGPTGWTVINQGGGGSWFGQTGIFSPLNGFLVPLPPEGAFAAMTDQFGPGTHVLYQDFVVPSNVSLATLSFQLFLRNTAAFVSGPGLNAFGPPNQQARVDILLASSDPFSVAASDVLRNVYRTQPGDPLVSGYSTVTADLTSVFAARGGQMLRLRFAQVGNLSFFNMGVNAVSLNASAGVNVVPVPSGLLVVVTGLPMFAGVLWRRRLEPVTADPIIAADRRA